MYLAIISIVIVVAIALVVAFIVMGGDDDNGTNTGEGNERVETGNNNQEDTGSDNTVEESPSGLQELQKQVLEQGSGSVAIKAGDSVTIHLEGRLSDGRVFDSSFDRGEPLSFEVGQNEVGVEGIDRGLLGSVEGEVILLSIPYRLAYGEEGYGSIPPREDVEFRIEILSIN